MTYLDFALEVFGYLPGPPESFKVRVASSPVGERAIDMAEEVSIPAGLRQRLRQLERRALNIPEMIELGEQLADLFFPPRVRLDYYRSRERLAAEGQGLRLRIKFHTAELANLPYEYTYIGKLDAPAGRKDLNGFLALDRHISLVRSEVLAQAPHALQPVGDRSLRLVALLANPQSRDYPELNLEKEQQQINEALSVVDKIEPEFYPQATIQTLQDALVSNADVFHFSGHGDFKGDMGASLGSEEGEGYILLEDRADPNNPLPWPMRAEKLALNLRNSGVRLALLGACESGRRDGVNPWSSVAAALIVAGIPAVLSMQYTVRDENVIHFSRAFYRAVAEGQPIDLAVTLGRIAIANHCREENERDWGAPVLYLHGTQSVLFPRPQEISPPQATIHSIPAGDAVPDRTTSAPVAPQPPTVPPADINKRALREAIVDRFNLEDLELLCADIEQDMADNGIILNVNLEVVGGAGKTAKVLNLIQYLDRRGYLQYLVDAVRRARPGAI
jgi:hypothetical protein